MKDLLFDGAPVYLTTRTPMQDRPSEESKMVASAQEDGGWRQAAARRTFRKHLLTLRSVEMGPTNGY